MDANSELIAIGLVMKALIATHPNRPALLSEINQAVSALQIHLVKDLGLTLSPEIHAAIQRYRELAAQQ